MKKRWLINCVTVCILGLTCLPAFADLTGKMLYIESQADILIKNADGTSQKVPLPTDFGYVGTAQWSADGSWITFNGNIPNNSQIYVVRPDGTGLRRVTDGTGNLVQPSFSPDDSKIAYSEVYGNLHTINFDDGTGDVEYPINVSHAEWSPIANKVVYSNWALVGYYADLFVYDLDTRINTQITYHQAGESFATACWSPNGQELAVSKGRADIHLWDVVVMHADGTNAVNLTEEDGFSSSLGAGWPSWSPDGRNILFGSEKSGDSDIWSMSYDGTNKINLTLTPNLDEHVPQMTIPEPATLLLLGLGGLLLRRKRSKT